MAKKKRIDPAVARAQAALDAAKDELTRAITTNDHGDFVSCSLPTLPAERLHGVRTMRRAAGTGRPRGTGVRTWRLVGS